MENAFTISAESTAANDKTHLDRAARLQAFSVMPELILDGCGFNFAYYGVQANGRPPVSPELIKEVEGLLSEIIENFSRFCNFTSDGKLRYLCNYSHGTRHIPFTGVAYWKVTDAIQLLEDAAQLESDVDKRVW